MRAEQPGAGEDFDFHERGSEFAYGDGGRVRGGEPAEEQSRDDYDRGAAEFQLGRVSAEVGEVSEERGFVPVRADSTEYRGQHGAVHDLLRERDAAEDPGPGL